MKRPGPPWPDALVALDWSQPWLRPFAPHGPQVVEAALQAHRRGDSMAAALNSALQPATWPFAIEFVADSALEMGETAGFGLNHGAAAVAANPHRLGYEAQVHQRRQVPLRDGLHDFFNALIWWRWPRLKAQLNALHVQHDAGPQRPRGAVRDALTLLDENGAVVLGPEGVRAELHRLQAQRDWLGLLWDRRALWAHAQVQVLGHALLEQLCTEPRLNLIAHVWWPALPRAADGPADTGLAQAAATQTWAPKPFVPLPVRGLPSWSVQAEQRDFYLRHDIFRPAPASADPRP